MKHLLTLFLLLSLTASAADDDEIARTSDGALWVGLLSIDEEREFEGCSCAFYALKDKSRALTGWYQGEESRIPLRVNGNTERLALLGEQNDRTGDPGGEPQEGDLTTYLLANERTNAALNCQISETCWDQSGCEYIEYSCSIEVEAQGGKLVIPAVGGCGC